jgi:hypothetical protein
LNDTILKPQYALFIRLVIQEYYRRHQHFPFKITLTHGPYAQLMSEVLFFPTQENSPFIYHGVPIYEVQANKQCLIFHDNVTGEPI